MKHPILLTICWMSLIYSNSGVASKVRSRDGPSGSPGSLNSKWNLVKDRHRQAERNFIGAEIKPQLNQRRTSTSDTNTAGLYDSRLTPDGSSHVPAKLHSSVTERQSVFSFTPICSPERYVVTLNHGICYRRVTTKMCYGHCKSYVVPSKLGRNGFQSEQEAQRSVSNVCYCCTSADNKTTSKRYEIRCNTAEGWSRRIFHVPEVENCNCRPCYVP